MLKGYEEYKSTPEAIWYSQIPMTWESTKMRTMFTERVAKVSDKDYPALSVGKMGIVPQLDTAVKTDNGDNRKLICEGDFAINSRSDRKGSSGISNYTGSCSLIITVLKPYEQLNRKYYHYLLRSNGFVEEFYRNGHGLVSDLWTTKWQEMKNIFIPVPPKAEQDQIVRYLDWKVSEMNRFIHEKKKQIRDLKELKLSLINKAVTKGINPNTGLKYSGYPWIGNIPSHWNMEYSKHFFSLRKEKARLDDEQLTSSQQYGIISQAKFMEIENRRVTVVMTGDDILKHVSKGDFVISMRSFQGGIEYSMVEGKISSAYVMLIPNHKYVDDEYYKWLFKSQAYIKALQGTSDLVRDGQALRYSNFAKVYLPNIPLEEQRQIAKYLNEQTPVIDNAIEKIKQEIALIEELKTKTIADVVTGQVDVRNVVIPEYASAEEDEDDLDSEDVEEELDESDSDEE